MSVGKARDQLIPVLLVWCFLYPVLEGAIFVNDNFRYVGKEEAEIFDNVVFVVKEGMSNSANSVACRNMWSTFVVLACQMVRKLFSQWSSIGRQQSCYKREVCHRTFSLRHFVFLPHILSSLTLAVYVECFNVRKLPVCLKGISSLTRFHIPTRVDSWVWHKTGGICSRCWGGGSSRRFLECPWIGWPW
jgi:hypothetical protein